MTQSSGFRGVAVETIGTDNPFTREQERAIVAFAAALIPASREYNAPSAGDPAIAQEILAAAKRAPAAVAAAVKALDEAASARHGARFAEVDGPARAGLLREANQPAADQVARAFDPSALAGQRTLVSIVAQCYYRDDRVLRSVGMEPRPPFPKGFDVEQGDWSLLEPVKRRGRLYREVDG